MSFLGSVFGNSILQSIITSTITEGFTALNAIIAKDPRFALLAPELVALEASFEAWLTKFLAAQVKPVVPVAPAA